MIKLLQKIGVGIAALLLVFTMPGCVKDEFDAPPAGGQDPNITATHTIAQLKALYTGATLQLTNDIIIVGVVTADDKSGNFYKTMVIQDATGGISIRLDQSNYYTKFPIGRRVFVKCKGLYIGEYRKLIQLGGSIDNTDPQNPTPSTIPSTLVSTYLVGGKYGIVTAPVHVSIQALHADPVGFINTYQSMLVKFDTVEFAAADTSRTYADAVSKLSVNRNLTNCTNNSIIVRTSGYSNFASRITPAGNGSLVAIMSVFSTGIPDATKAQLLLRDENDVRMSNLRCNSVPPPPGSLITIAALRAMYAGTTMTVPAGNKIKGIVITDKDNGNITAKNLILQDSTGGIVVRFTANNSFVMNSEIELSIGGMELSTFSGQLQLNNVPNANATQTGTGTVTPKVATISQIITNFNAWESTLVKIMNTTITGTSGTTYGSTSGNRTLNDGTGTLILYTQTAASFANTNHPTGSVSVTGILVPFNTTKEIVLRNLSDVQ